MQIRTRFWSIGKVLLITAALVVTFLVSFGIAMRVALRAGQVQVPDLRGQTVGDATLMLRDVELLLREDENRRADDKVPAGRVMQQDPPPGTDVRPQRSIRVWISSGPPTTRVPALVSQTERTARMRIEQEGLQIATVSEIRSPDYPADSIVSQQPPPSTRAPQVSLLVNRGDPSTTYVMPDVIGMDGARVEVVLRGHGFRVTTVGSQPYPGIPPGTVVRQQPAAGAQVGPADPVSLEVSR